MSQEYEWSAPSTVTGTPGTPQEGQVLARRFYEEVWNQGKVELVDQLFHPDFIQHCVYAPMKSAAECKAFVSQVRGSFPEQHLTIDDLFAEGDKVLVRFTWRAIDALPRGKHVPTGKPLVMTGMCAYRVAGGKLVESWESRDRLNWGIQFGDVALVK
jgi:predicted SnoaL-like aldol condensation-catalyzing enzyme